LSRYPPIGSSQFNVILTICNNYYKYKIASQFYEKPAYDGLKKRGADKGFVPYGSVSVIYPAFKKSMVLAYGQNTN